MTNLPITSNSPQSTIKGTPGDTTQPAPRPSEGRASGGIPSSGARNGTSATSGDAASTAQANSAANDRVAEPFSVLLARQISDSGSPDPNSTKIFVAIHGKSTTCDADQTTKDAQDQATSTTNITSDPANPLAAMLMQIPVQQTDALSQSTPAVDAALLRGDPSRLSTEAGGIKQRVEVSLKRTADKLRGAENALPTTGNRQQADSSTLIPLSSDAIKHLEIKVSSIGQPQTSQNITKEVPSAASSAVMSNIIPTGDIHADTQQNITTPLGNSGWADEFSQKIVWMNNQQNQIAELHLNPPDLGPLNVVLKISDNQLTAQFTSPHSAVRDAVENALPKLREILADNNITLGNATVSDQAPRDRGAEGFMNQGSGTAAQHEAAFNASESNSLSPTTTQSVPVRRHNGMLDIFA